MLGILVFVHELGHFLVAKACGVRVLVFSLGFGPRVFGFRRGHTDYRISALPLGGYVRMFGDDFTEDIAEEDFDKSFLYKPIPQKAAVSFAGPFANFLLPVILFFAFFVGDEVVPSTLLGTVLPESPAALAGIQSGDRIMSIGGTPTEHFDELRTVVEEKPGQTLDVVIEREGETQTLSVEVGVLKNINPYDDQGDKGRLGVMPMAQESMVWVAEESAAYDAGARTRDLIAGVDGAPLTRAAQWREASKGLKTVSKISLLRREMNEGKQNEKRFDTSLGASRYTPKTLSVVVDDTIKERIQNDAELKSRIDKTQTLLQAFVDDLHKTRGIAPYAGTIERVFEKSVGERLGIEKGDLALFVNGSRVFLSDQFSRRMLERPDDIHAAGFIKKDGTPIVYVFALEKAKDGFMTFGAIPGGDGYAAGENLTRRVGIGEALSRSIERTYTLGRVIVKGLFMLFTGQLGLDSLGGPVTIVRIAGEAARAGFSRYVEVMAFISVNLGIVNLLPIPVLDGGHLTMFAIEALQRRRLTAKTRGRALVVGLVLILSLFVVVIVNDIIQLF